MEYTNYELMKVLETGIELSRERNRNRLLDSILSESMEITNCDAGTLFLYKDEKLYFKLMKTISMNIDKGKDGESIELPPVEMNADNICAYTVLHRTVLNIENVYDNTEFDFEGPRRYDKITGYHTQSMLTIPLLNQDEIVGVLQLINSMDEQGNAIAFEKRVEPIILSLASLAAIAISNIYYMEEIKTQMWSFTEAMAETIDMRTPYNANHVRMVAYYVEKMADYINVLHEKGIEEEYFSENRKEQLVLGALLHDIGKITVPTKIMNKGTRLEENLEIIRSRFELFATRYKVQMLEGRITQDTYDALIQRLSYIMSLVEEVNTAECLTDSKMSKLNNVLDAVYVGEEGTIPYFTEEEKKKLLIRRGTSTEEERNIMESHVLMTERILKKVHFNYQYKDTMKWAVQHHEYLDGSGYPRHLKAEELEMESRMLAVADICDALLATDRPYKKPLSREKAFGIMHEMAKKGKLDEKMVKYLEESF